MALQELIEAFCWPGGGGFKSLTMPNAAQDCGGQDPGAEGACKGDGRLWERALKAGCEAGAVPLAISSGAFKDILWSSHGAC